jgi:chromosome partitioning protein
MGKVIAVVGLKGGSGKTTVTVGLASAMPGSLVIDMDLQASASKWAQASGGKINVVGPGADLQALIQPARDAGGWVFIDTPPGHPETTAAALRTADEALIPIGPSPLDVAQVTETLRLIASVRPELPVCVVLNRVRAGTLIGEAARSALAEDGVPVADAALPERVGIQSAFGTLELGPYFAALAEEVVA